MQKIVYYKNYIYYFQNNYIINKYSCRNHCPYCLHSKHVDVNPGDRKETCHGDLEPIGIELNPKKGYVIIFKCKKCGMIRKNKAAKDDNMDLIIKLSANNEII